MDERNLRDHVDSSEVGVDIVFMPKKLGDSDFDFVSFAKFVFGGIAHVVDVFRTNAVNDLVIAGKRGFEFLDLGSAIGGLLLEFLVFPVFGGELFFDLSRLVLRELHFIQIESVVGGFRFFRKRDSDAIA